MDYPVIGQQYSAGQRKYQQHWGLTFISSDNKREQMGLAGAEYIRTTLLTNAQRQRLRVTTYLGDKHSGRSVAVAIWIDNKWSRVVTIESLDLPYPAGNPPIDAPAVTDALDWAECSGLDRALQILQEA